MIKAEFNYKGNITPILCSENQTMEEICKRFATEVKEDITNLLFLYSGININLQNTLSQTMNTIDKQRKVISILVNQINTITKTKTITNLVKSDIPICLQCFETIKFDINNFNIYLSECRNRHIKYLHINEYEITQYIDLNKIICKNFKNCGTNKNNAYNNKMYMCLTKAYYVHYVKIVMIKNTILLIMTLKALCVKGIMKHIILIVCIAKLIYA